MDTLKGSLEYDLKATLVNLCASPQIAMDLDIFVFWSQIHGVKPFEVNDNHPLATKWQTFLLFSQIKWL